jgi:hypothetical protein
LSLLASGTLQNFVQVDGQGRPTITLKGVT